MAISTIKVGASIKHTFRTEVTCSHPFVIDQPKAGGGNDEGPNPLEVFLTALPACICAIGRIVANQRRIKLNGIEVSVEGDIDKDYLMGKTTEGRAGYTEIRSYVKIDADMTEEEKKAFLRDVEARCPIADNMANKSTIIAEVVK
ncbi:MAG: OsmC family protein [Bacteroidales bacterium]|nr:OsmC family protein [Bacteroidales bacterium]HPD95941.1 OsmC family protein [Tenuifilaceae bacterium]HRX30935.1 OsmC family protein [Tenuifilaceae bacterium]